jgi:hypothetical protein
MVVIEVNNIGAQDLQLTDKPVLNFFKRKYKK